MRKLLALSLLLATTLVWAYRVIPTQVTIGGSVKPSTSAALMLADGYLELDTMTTTERDALPSAASGAMIYNSTNKTIEGYTNAAWSNVLFGASGIDDMVDVSITNVADNELLIYESASALWKNQANTWLDGIGASDTTGLALWNGAGGDTLMSSSVTVDASSNITTPGDLSVADVEASGLLSVSGTATLESLQVDGSVTAAFLYGDGSNLSNVVASVSTNVAYLDRDAIFAESVTSTYYYGTGMQVTGSITAAYLYGDGSNLSNVAASVSTNVAYLDRDAIFAESVTSTNFYGDNAILTGRITAAYLYGDGSNITGVSASVSTNVAYLDRDAIFAESVTSTYYYGTGMQVTGSVSATTLYGDGSNLTGIDASISSIFSLQDVVPNSVTYGHALVYDSTSAAWVNKVNPNMAVFTNVVTADVASTAGDTILIPINTQEGGTSFATLSSSQITVTTGEYAYRFCGIFRQANGCQILLWNATSGTLQKNGQAGFIAAAVTTAVPLCVSGKLFVATSTTYEVKGFVEAGDADGFGRRSDAESGNDATASTFLTGWILKIR